ncbi:MAG: adenine methyltransferase [Bacteroidetes bacterium]|nr:adenine methyltransferase [Bacteroidota bacterium]
MNPFNHQSSVQKNDEWLTPPEIIKALGEFDLDPCSPINRPWNTAKKHFTIEDNGFLQEWEGRVWLNPPYGQYTEKWLSRMASHNNGIVLTFARVDTNWFHEWIFRCATGILFLKGRPHFYLADGTMYKNNSGAPVCLAAFGDENFDALNRSGLAGKLVRLKECSDCNDLRVEVERCYAALQFKIR